MLHFYAVVIFFTQDVGIKASRDRLLLIKLQKKVERSKNLAFNTTYLLKKIISFRNGRYEKKIVRLENELENQKDINKVSSQSGKARIVDKNILIKAASLFLLLIAILILLLCLLGYYFASNTRIIKTIPKEYIDISINERINAELNDYSYDYAVLFESDSSFLICPYKEKYSKEINFFPTIQVEIDKKGIVVFIQSVNKIRH